MRSSWASGSDDRAAVGAPHWGGMGVAAGGRGGGAPGEPQPPGPALTQPCTHTCTRAHAPVFLHSRSRGRTSRGVQMCAKALTRPIARAALPVCAATPLTPSHARARPRPSVAPLRSRPATSLSGGAAEAGDRACGGQAGHVCGRAPSASGRGLSGGTKATRGLSRPSQCRRAPAEAGLVCR